MKQRTILLFPRLEEIEQIQSLREKYDPLAKLIRPHITLVFPFEGPWSDAELAAILERHCENFSPFPLTLGGISLQEDPFGNYLFLNVLEGRGELSALHEAFYAREFRPFDAGVPYVPHMTIGKFSTAEQISHAWNRSFLAFVVKFIQTNRRDFRAIPRRLFPGAGL